MDGDRYWITPITDSGTRCTAPAKHSNGTAVNRPLPSRTTYSVPDAETSASCPLINRAPRNTRTSGSTTVNSMASMSSGGRFTVFLMRP